MRATLQALAGSASSLRGQIQVSPGSFLMALVICLLLTQARANFSSLWVVGVTSWLLCWLELWCPPHRSLQCMLHTSPSLSILLLTSERPCVCTNPNGAVQDPFSSFSGHPKSPREAPWPTHTRPGAILWASSLRTMPPCLTRTAQAHRSSGGPVATQRKPRLR